MCHAVVLQHFPPLPLELLYPLLLLLSSFCVPLLQQPGQRGQNWQVRTAFFKNAKKTFLLSKWWRHNCATSSYRTVFVCADDVWRVSEKGRWKVGKGAISAPLYTVTQFQSLLSALVRLVLSSPCQSVYRFVFSSMASQRTWCRPETSEVKPTVVRTSTEYFATNVVEITVKAEFPERFGLM